MAAVLYPLRWAAVVLTLTALALVAAAPAGSAATSDERLAVIVAPTQEDVVARSVAVRVRVRPGVRFRAFVGDRSVTHRFGPPRRGIRQARLRRGRELERGVNHVAVRTRAGRRADFDSVPVVVARRDRGFLTVRGAPRRATTRTPVVRANWRSHPHGLRASLNGRRVSREFLTRSGTIKRAHLGADDGLRFGANRLVVIAYDHAGRFDREVRHFRVPRQRPLVGIGRDRTAAVGRPLRVDGRKSRATRRGAKLAYRWSIVRRPTGSKARLANPTSARPTLTPDVRGRYRLRLRLSEPRRGSRGRASQLQPLTAADTMEILAPTLVGPLGYGVSTITPGGQGVQVGGTTYAPGGNWVQVVLLDRKTLTRRNVNLSLPARNHPGTGLYAFNTGDDPNLLRDLLTGSRSGIDASYLVVMTGGGRQIDINKGQWQALTYAFGQLGGTMDPFRNNGKGNSDPGFANGAWSLIGVPGISAGSAAQNSNLAPAPGQPAGGISGRLAWDTHDNFTFIAGDYETFDTNATRQKAGAGGTNQVKVEGATYTSDPLGADQSGFQVVALDAGTLAPRANRTFVTNRSGRQDVGGVQNMAAMIDSYVDARAEVVFLIESIGAPNPLHAAWTGPNPRKGPPSLSSAIDAIGGTQDLFNLLPSAGSQFGYSLVGGTQLSATEAAENALNPENPTLAPPPARLRGVLKRGDQYDFRPAATSSFDSPVYGGFDLSALELAFRPPSSAWPTHDTAAHRAAEDYIARRIFYPDLPATQRSFDLHTYYWYADWLSEAGTYASALGNVCPESGTASAPQGSPFTSADLRSVCAQIRQEFTWVQAVWGMTRSVKASFIQQEITGPSSASSIATAITDALKKQRSSNPESELLSDVLLVEGTLLEVASELIFATASEEDPAGDLAEAAGDGILSGLFDLAADMSNSPSGQPDLSSFDTKAKDLGFEIQAKYRNAIGGADKLAQMLVSDYSKLSTAGPKAQDPQTWGFGEDRLNRLENSVELSTTRFLWSQFLPGAYQVYNLGPGGSRWLQAGQRTWTPRSYTCFNNDNGLPGGTTIRPWRTAPASAWQNQTVGIKDGKPYRQPNVLASNKTRFSGYSNQNQAVEGYPGAPVPRSLTDPLFKPVIADQFGNTDATLLTQVGLNKPEFLSESQGVFERVDVRC